VEAVPADMAPPTLTSTRVARTTSTAVGKGTASEEVPQRPDDDDPDEGRQDRGDLVPHEADRLEQSHVTTARTEPLVSPEQAHHGHHVNVGGR
jgi:hypothetical protein